MDYPRLEEFLNSVIREVKFRPDRDEIREELKNHIIDSKSYYKDEGYSELEAINMAIDSMGNAVEIGRGLNKQHSLFLGYLSIISNTILIIMVCISTYMGIVMFLYPLLVNHEIDIPKEDIVYSLDVGEKRIIDNRIIKVDKVIYTRDGVMNILYHDYERPVFTGGWSFSNLGRISDGVGNEYFPSSGHNTGGVFTRSIIEIDEFPKDADELHIDYDYYNRSYSIVIPLNVGDKNE